MARIGRLQVSCDYGDGSDLYVEIYRITEVEIEGVLFVGYSNDASGQNGVTWFDDVNLSNTSHLDSVFRFGGTNTYTWLTAMTEVPDDSVEIEYPISIANGGTGATTAAQALVNLGAASASALASLSDTVADKANANHTHSSYATLTALNALSDEVDGKAAAGHTHSNYATSSHAHSIANITNLQSTLDGKADASHTHSGYAASNHTHSNYASSSHTHTISNITNLQSTLDGKADANHTHVTPCCTITGSSSSQSLTAGTMTRVSLNTFSVNTDSSCFSAYDNGVKVSKAGYYQISASAYMTCSATSGIRVIHIHQNSTEIATVRSEEGGSYASQGGIATAPKVVYLNAGDVIYLKVRSMVSAATLAPNNCATYLSIVKM